MLNLQAPVLDARGTVFIRSAGGHHQMPD